MAEGNGNGEKRSLRSVADSNLALILARFVAPALLALLTYLAAEMRGDLRDSIRDVSDIKGKLNLIEYRMDRLERKP